MNDVIFVDVETTGLSAQNDSIIQLGVIRTDPTGEVVKDLLNIKVRPTTPVHPAAAVVNGYTPEKWADALEPAEAVKRLLAIGKGAEFAAHCVWFDHGFCEKLIRDHGHKVPWGRRLIDTQTLAHMMRAVYPEMKGTNLQSCIEKLGGDRGSVHDAMDDAEWARQVYRWAIAQVAPTKSEKLTAVR